MKCPVCGHVFGEKESLADMFSGSMGKDVLRHTYTARQEAGEDICGHCGFAAMRSDFVNKQDAESWMRNVVIPYRNDYISKTNDFWAIKQNCTQLRNPAADNAFFNRFFEIVNRNEMLSCPVNGEHPHIEFHPVDYFGGYFLAVYSSLVARKPGDSKTVLTIPASGVIKVLYDTPQYSGIIVDPNSNPKYIPRKLIHNYTNCKDSRLEIKDWGAGIPRYKASDIQTKEELIDFGFEIIERFYIEKQSYEVLEHYPMPRAVPHYALRKDGKLYFLQIDVGVYPNTPEMSETSKKSFLAACNRFGAIGLFASIQIESADNERAAASLALCGDGFSIYTPVVSVIS